MSNASGNASYISRRPAWADHVRIDGEAVDYTWTAPTVAEAIDSDGEIGPALVDLTREDALYVNDVGVVLDPGVDRIFLLDTNFDVENARKLAIAINEACNRLQSAEDER